MYENPGVSIKRITSFLVWVGIIVDVIAGIYLMQKGAYHSSYYGTVHSRVFYLGLVVFILGPILAWLSGLLFAAFGDMCANIHDLKSAVQGIQENVESRNNLNNANACEKTFRQESGKTDSHAENRTNTDFSPSLLPSKEQNADGGTSYPAKIDDPTADSIDNFKPLS